MKLVIILIALCALVSPAQARKFHRHMVSLDRGEVTGGRPSGCPAHAWCGCWLAAHLGMSDRGLWLAQNWAHVGSQANGPGERVIAVWRHHVGLITAVDGNKIKLLSGNDGNQVRERWRPISGIIAYRYLG